MCSKVLNGHIILTDTSITTILAPEMTYTPYFLASRKYCCDLSRLRDWSIIVFVSLRIVR